MSPLFDDTTEITDSVLNAISHVSATSLPARLGEAHD